MSKLYDKGVAKFAFALDYTSAVPSDTRDVVATLTDLKDPKTWVSGPFDATVDSNNVYTIFPTMRVGVKAEKAIYVFVADTVSAATIAADASWSKLAASQTTDTISSKLANSSTLKEVTTGTGDAAVTTIETANSIIYVEAVAASGTEGEEGYVAGVPAHIALVDKNNKELSTVPVSDIIGNGVLDHSSYDKESGNLTLSFKQSDGSTKDEVVNLSDMLDINDVLVDTDSANYLGVDLNGGENSLAKFSAKIVKIADASKDVLYTAEDTLPEGKNVGDVKTAGNTGLADAADVKDYVDSAILALDLVHTSVADKTEGHIAVSTDADTKVVTISENDIQSATTYTQEVTNVLLADENTAGSVAEAKKAGDDAMEAVGTPGEEAEYISEDEYNALTDDEKALYTYKDEADEAGNHYYKEAKAATGVYEAIEDVLDKIGETNLAIDDLDITVYSDGVDLDEFDASLEYVKVSVSQEDGLLAGVTVVAPTKSLSDAVGLSKATEGENAGKWVAADGTLSNDGLATAADVAAEIVADEKVIAAALNDHETRILSLEGDDKVHTTVADKTTGHVTVATNADTKVVTISENDIASAALLGSASDDSTKNTAFGKAAAAQADATSALNAIGDEAVLYTAEEAAAANTASGATEGDENYVSEGDVKTDATGLYKAIEDAKQAAINALHTKTTVTKGTADGTISVDGGDDIQICTFSAVAISDTTEYADVFN